MEQFLFLNDIKNSNEFKDIVIYAWKSQLLNYIISGARSDSITAFQAISLYIEIHNNFTCA